MLYTRQNLPYLNGIIGNSPLMLEVYQQIARAIISDVPVLVTGETGTGKELVARAIHDDSRNQNGTRSGPFVATNCAAIPETLFEAELFGHRKGAYTGADESRDGLFVQADKGTILLDEIGDMDPRLQAKLLRVIEDKMVYPLGTRTPKKVDFRIIATTNQNLEHMIQEGRFREDLYYRLQRGVDIHMPPLRERKEDIPELVMYFLQMYAQKYNLAIKGVVPNVLERLGNNPWRGNVRELEGVVENAILSAKIANFKLELLPDRYFLVARVYSNTNQQTTVQEDKVSDKSLNWRVSIKEAQKKVEAELLRHALEQTGWNMTKAAELVKLSYKAFLYKCKELGLRRH